MPPDHRNGGELPRSAAHKLQSAYRELRTPAITIPKNKSMGNLTSNMSTSPESSRDAKHRSSRDDGWTPTESRRSSLMIEHDRVNHGPCGLKRIRQAPFSRPPTQPPSPEASFAYPSGQSSTALSRVVSLRERGGDTPNSPTFGYQEDLVRFSTESLHSFSFAKQSEETLFSRQEILRKSLDYMQSQRGWGSSHPGVLKAAAKLSGNADYQEVVELLEKAQVLGTSDSSVDPSVKYGPLTALPIEGGANPFDQQFSGQSQSPTEIEPQPPSSETHAHPKGDTNTRQTSSGSEVKIRKPTTVLSRPNFSLKRTLTSTESISIKTKLADALAKPYFVQSPPTASELSAAMLNRHTNPESSNALSFGVSPTNEGHQRYTPASQAIFSTTCTAPWTILAANDLACLVFGVTLAELRKLGILEVIREDRREWLEEKLRGPGSEATAKTNASTASAPPSRKTSLTSVSSSLNSKAGGITALLLSKKSSHQIKRDKELELAQSNSDSSSTQTQAQTQVTTTDSSSHHKNQRSRGVLLCGDVLPIKKRNGVTGSASVWVKEKRGGLIWIVEEILEDKVSLCLNRIGEIMTATGAADIVFGYGSSLNGYEARELIPSLPTVSSGSPKLDFAELEKQTHFAARNETGLNIPITVTANEEKDELQISSFPHIAGIIVVSADNLLVASSNVVAMSSLLGYDSLDGLHIDDLIPNFENILKILQEEDRIDFADGLLIPEHSFRRARTSYVSKINQTSAAEMFLHEAQGLPAKHRDGSEILIDIQMRVVMSEARPDKDQPLGTIDENAIVQSELVYALWVTYSRHIHSLTTNGLPTPLISRPATPPHQPSPGQSVVIKPASELEELDVPTPPAESDKQLVAPSEQQPTVDEKSITVTSAEPVAKPVEEVPLRKKTIDDFTILKDLGQGAYGQVKLVEDKQTHEKCVLKYVIKKRILVDTWTRDRKLGTVPLEIHVLNYLRNPELKHPNIVEMSGFFEDSVNYYIQMVPHGTGGDLFDYIEHKSAMSETECRFIFRQVVDAVHHLHTKAKVVHRDIKDENIILDENDRVKLIDFGSAAYVKSGPFDVFVGTLDYAAPEVLQGERYSGKPQDVWALGILLYTLVYKENPFYNIDEIIEYDLRVPWVMSEDNIDLIRKMLDRDVKQRLDIEGVMLHPWMTAE